MRKRAINKKKELGQVFTAEYIVDMILDEVGYIGENILNKKIIEPSFGDGAFLVKIIERLIDYCMSINMTKEKIVEQLENNIYGIEIDTDLYKETLNKLDKLVTTYNIDKVKWNLLNENTLYYCRFDEFDFVVGNPPYIRVHNLDNKTKEIIKDFNFSNGTTDIYILFFELSINLLNKNGILGFITPNSYMKNTSQGTFRKYLIEKNLISKIIDFKSSSVFDDAKTYNAITIINRNKDNRNLIYTQYEKDIILYTSKIDLKDYMLNEKAGLVDSWNFNSEEDNNLLISIKNRDCKIGEYCNVQYGINTNRNAIFINKIEVIEGEEDYVLFNGYKIERKILKPVVKGSTYNGILDNKMILFPYNWNFNEKAYEPIVEEELLNKYPLTYKYLFEFKEELLKRDMDDNATTWYQFGRSQGLSNSRYKKLVFKHIISANRDKLDIYEVSEDTIVYSGIYITVPDEESLIKVKEVLSSEEFCRYCILVGKDMRGGYKNISSKHIKSYGIYKNR